MFLHQISVRQHEFNASFVFRLKDQSTFTIYLTRIVGTPLFSRKYTVIFTSRPLQNAFQVEKKTQKILVEGSAGLFVANAVLR